MKIVGFFKNPYVKLAGLFFLSSFYLCSGIGMAKYVVDYKNFRENQIEKIDSLKLNEKDLEKLLIKSQK